MDKTLEQPLNQCIGSIPRLIGVGVDLCSIERVTLLINKHTQNTLEYLYHYDDYHYCLQSHDPFYAFTAGFALKEAFGKALGTGMAGLVWRDIRFEIKNAGVALIMIESEVAKLTQNLGVERIQACVKRETTQLVSAMVALYG